MSDLPTQLESHDIHHLDDTAGVTIYQSDTGAVEVRLDRDTVWLTQRQMAEVFDTTPENVLTHLKNIYADQELPELATAKNFLAVRSEGRRQVKRQLRHYNLDAIISVGYRVNSKRAVGFRQWATRTLREHLTQGYTLNRQRLDANARELEAALELVRKAAHSPDLAIDTGRGLVDIVSRYAQTFALLQRYDEGLLGNLDQSVFGQPAYPSVEAKAAHLLYFVIKNHPFADGNKRSGAFLFVDFLNRNGRLIDASGVPVINDIGLAALALLVAESDPTHKETMIRLIMNMLAVPRP